jgi:hypothetical protein
VGPAHQKTRRPISRPARPDMWTRRREDSLVCKTSQSRQIKATQISLLYCNWLEIGFPVVTNLDSDPATLSVTQYKAGKGVLPRTTWDRINTNRRTGCRVLLSRGPNQYEITLSLVSRHDFRVLRYHNHRVLSSRSLCRTNKPLGLTPLWTAQI